MEEDDVSLLAAWQHGDARAGDALTRRHFSAIYGFFRNKVGEAAEELTQRTFLGAAKALPRLRPELGIRAYLFAVARRQLLLYLRTRARNPDPEPIGTRSLADLGLPTPSSAWANRHSQELVWRALREIPLDLQILVELHYWEGFTMRQIAQVLEVAPGTIKSRLARARAQLAIHLERLAATPEIARSTLAGLRRTPPKDAIEGGSCDGG